MFFRKSNRRELLETAIFRKAPDVEEGDPTRLVTDVPLAKDELYLLWDREISHARPYPSAMVTNAAAKADVLAVIASHADFPKPFSAYCRVMSQKEFAALCLANDRSTSGPQEAIAVALIMIEAILRGGGEISLAEISGSACKRTMSYPLAALLLGQAPNFWFDELCNNWELTYSRFSGDDGRQISRDVRAIWEAVFAVVSPRDLGSQRDLSSEQARIVGLSKAIVQNSDKSTLSRLWKDLSGDLRASALEFDQSRRTREERLEALQRYIAALRGNVANHPLVSSFLIGHLTSQVSPGTLDHVTLLLDAVKKDPSILLWYGFCAGLAKEHELYEAGNGLGLRVIRDIQRPAHPYSYPEADVSFDELNSVADRKSVPFRTVSPNIIDVELMPTLVGAFRMAAPGPQTDLFSKQLDELQLELSDQVTREIDVAVSVLQRARRMLTELIPRRGGRSSRERGRRP